MRDIYRKQLPAGLALGAVLTAFLWDRLIPGSELSSWSTAAVLMLIAALAGVHAPLGAGGLALGAMVFPVVSHFFRLTTIGWVAAGAYVLRTLVAAAWYQGRRQSNVSRDLVTQTAAAGTVLTAATVGAVVWKTFGDLESVTSGEPNELISPRHLWHSPATTRVI